MPRRRLSENQGDVVELEGREALSTSYCEDRSSEERVGSYFVNPTDVQFFSSGCAILDCVLGGGWAEDRFINVTGDSSSGKTLLAIEACANFLRKHPEGKVWYCETEAAFDYEYAEALGIPIDSIEFIEDVHTVEELHASFEEVLKELDGQDTKTLYVIDSLDALSDKSELERSMSEGSYGTSKARKLSELLRRMNAELHKSNVTVFTVSQTRENIGVSFGERYTRAGGKAIRFYASQELWLALTGKIEKTSKGVKRVVGVKVRARVKKNKCGLPHRECDFEILFGYGIDDLKANLQWLESVKELERHFGEKEAKSLLKASDKLSDDEFSEFRDKVAEAVRESWREIESRFLPNRRKY